MKRYSSTMLTKISNENKMWESLEHVGQLQIRGVHVTRELDQLGLWESIRGVGSWVEIFFRRVNPINSKIVGIN